MQESKGKSALEIMAGIEKREKQREPQLMALHLAMQSAERHKEKLNTFDIEKQR